MIWFEQLLLGLTTSRLASLPLRILNTTAAQTAVINNLKAAFNFTLGDALIEYFQIVVALYMNKLLQLITQIELYFSLSCIPLFLILAF
jgi:hypothetical protein